MSLFKYVYRAGFIKWMARMARISVQATWLTMARIIDPHVQSCIIFIIVIYIYITIITILLLIMIFIFTTIWLSLSVLLLYYYQLLSLLIIYTSITYYLSIFKLPIIC